MLFRSHRFTLSKKWAEDGLCKKYGLQGRQWKVVVDEVFNTLSAKIEQIKKTVRIDISKNKKFSNEEHHYLMYLLCFNELLYNICNGRSMETEKKFNISTERKFYLQRYLHSRMRKRCGGKPISRSLSFTIDQDMYNVEMDEKGRNWIAISSLVPRDMIKIMLTDKNPIRGSLKVKMMKDRIEIIETEIVPCKKLAENKSESIIGIDKGLKNLLNVDRKSVV